MSWSSFRYQPVKHFFIVFLLVIDPGKVCFLNSSKTSITINQVCQKFSKKNLFCLQCIELYLKVGLI